MLSQNTCFSQTYIEILYYADKEYYIVDFCYIIDIWSSSEASTESTIKVPGIPRANLY